jgi:hypothetical protein
MLGDAKIADHHRRLPPPRHPKPPVPIAIKFSVDPPQTFHAFFPNQYRSEERWPNMISIPDVMLTNLKIL